MNKMKKLVYKRREVQADIAKRACKVHALKVYGEYKYLSPVRVSGLICSQKSTAHRYRTSICTNKTFASCGCDDFKRRSSFSRSVFPCKHILKLASVALVK